MGESVHPRQRKRWSIERYESYAILAVVGTAMLYVSAESLSWGVVVGGAFGGAFGTATGVADDAEVDPEEDA